MKKVIALLLTFVLATVCIACKDQNVDIEPQIAQMKSICELAVMECYYHNVAKFEEENASGFLLWKKDKKFWIEYSGIVELGIDAALISMELTDDTVVITIPEAEVLDCQVVSESLTADSFFVDSKSAKIDAADEREAFAEAQQRMKKSAANNRALLINAQQRAQTLLENYVKNIGSAIGRDYSVQWKFIDAGNSAQDRDIAEPASIQNEVLVKN